MTSPTNPNRATGSNPPARADDLTHRAEQARAVLDAREREHREVIDAALNRMQAYRTSKPENLSDEEIAAGAADDTARQAERDYRQRDRRPEDAILAQPIAEADLDAATDMRTYRLLLQTAAAQQAIATLRDSHGKTAHAATALWVEYVHVHGRDEAVAAAQAWTDTYDGVQAIYDNAYNHLDYRAEQRHNDHAGPQQTADQQHARTRAIDPRTGAYQDDIDALVAGAPARLAQASLVPDDLDRLRTRLADDRQHHDGERHQVSGPAHPTPAIAAALTELTRRARAVPGPPSPSTVHGFDHAADRHGHRPDRPL